MQISDKMQLLVTKVTKFYMTICVVCLTLLIAIQPIFAADTTADTSAVVQVMCNAIKVMQGPLGKTVAVLVLFSLAFGMFFGKVSWGIGITTAAAMGILFGAESLVTLLTGQTFDCKSLIS